MKNIVLFGGAGFVGTHLERCLTPHFDRIIIADLVPPAHPGPKTTYVQTDVRRPIALSFAEPFYAAINLAAIHKTPGHSADEYFETNIRGAEHVVRFLEDTKTPRAIFTSSISVYGPGEDEKTESSVQMPLIPYGSSKAIAEYIHRGFLQAAPGRLLCILRPGVIFGRGEGGNFTRIARALRRGLFAYPGRKDTIKSCIYVKDLCHIMVRCLELPSGFHLFNACLPGPISLETICKSFHLALGYPLPRIVLPHRGIRMAGFLLALVRADRLLGLDIHPERITKLVHSTNVSARRLEESGYRFRYNLVSALKDWELDCGGKQLY